jgi:hypothetical protein
VTRKRQIAHDREPSPVVSDLFPPPVPGKKRKIPTSAIPTPPSTKRSAYSPSVGVVKLKGGSPPPAPTSKRRELHTPGSGKLPLPISPSREDVEIPHGKNDGATGSLQYLQQKLALMDQELTSTRSAIYKALALEHEAREKCLEASEPLQARINDLERERIVLQDTNSTLEVELSTTKTTLALVESQCENEQGTRFRLEHENQELQESLQAERKLRSELESRLERVDAGIETALLREVEARRMYNLELSSWKNKLKFAEAAFERSLMQSRDMKGETKARLTRVEEEKGKVIEELRAEREEREIERLELTRLLRTAKEGNENPSEQLEVSEQKSGQLTRKLRKAEETVKSLTAVLEENMVAQKKHLSTLNMVFGESKEMRELPSQELRAEEPIRSVETTDNEALTNTDCVLSKRNRASSVEGTIVDSGGEISPGRGAAAIHGEVERVATLKMLDCGGGGDAAAETL